MHHRLTVGLLTPHAAAGPELEIPNLSRGHVAVTVGRIHLPDRAVDASSTGPASAEALRDLARPEAVDQAAGHFRAGAVDVVAHASTTTGYVLGVRSEAVLVERLATQCGVPVVASARAAADALRACGAQRLILVHPPWFDAEMDRLGIGYFADQGLDVALVKATDLPGDPSRVRPAEVVDWAMRHLGDGEEALFLAGNGFRSARAATELEQRTSRLVLQANQVLLWAILAATDASMTVRGGGKLFDTVPTLPAGPR